MQDKYLMLEEKLKKYGQEQLLKFYTKIDKIKQNELLQDILNIDFEQLQNLYNNIQKNNKNIEAQIEPIEYINKEKLSLEEQKHYIKLGEEEIKKGKYAVVTMAGGQRNKTWTQWTKRNL